MNSTDQIGTWTEKGYQGSNYPYGNKKKDITYLYRT